MKPTTDALQVFYGTMPLIVVILGIWWREQMLLKDILTRLGAVEAAIKAAEKAIAKFGERLVVLETRAGIIYHP